MIPVLLPSISAPSNSCLYSLFLLTFFIILAPLPLFTHQSSSSYFILLFTPPPPHLFVLHPLTFPPPSQMARALSQAKASEGKFKRRDFIGAIKSANQGSEIPPFIVEINRASLHNGNNYSYTDTGPYIDQHGPALHESALRLRIM